MPPYTEFIKKFFELGVSPSDPNLKLLFQILEEDENEESNTTVIQEHNDVSNLNGEEMFGQSEEEFTYDDTCMT